MNFNNVAIVYVKGKAYRFHFWYISKDDAINIMNGSNLIDKMGVLYFFFFFFFNIRMSESIESNLLSKKQRCNTK